MTPRDRLEALAAELVGRPVYVLLASDGADFGSESTGGLYGRRLDLLARDHLQAAGRWQGRRPAVFIDDVRADAWQVEAIIVHELAHFADIGFNETPEAEVCDIILNFTRRIHEQSVGAPVERVSHDPQHSARFVRGCIHLWRRYQRTGRWCPPEWLWQGELYGAPEPIAVIRALGDEPDRLAKLPVSLVVDLPAPPQFDELFKETTTCSSH
jgi:hypothetical protein